MHRFVFLTGVLLLAAASGHAQQEIVLTLESALAHARESAPAIVAARMRIDESRPRVVGASLRSNPTAEVEAGSRSGSTTSTDYSLAIEQDFDLPSRRRARTIVAQAGLLHEEQRARDVEREVLRDVAIAFFRAVEARERADVAAAATGLAEQASRIARQRFDAGDVAQLDLNLARTAAARATADLRAALASVTARTAQLKVLLGIAAAEPVTVRGSLGEGWGLTIFDHGYRNDGDKFDHPDLRVLDAEIAEAEAEQRLAQTLRWPDLAFRASYSREEGDRILLGGIGVSLPFFNRGQEASALASARVARLRFEREALSQAIAAEMRGALAAHEGLVNASAEYKRNVLPLVEENEKLALESYEVGQIGLGDLLLVRREALDARRAHLDQLIETRLAEVELRARSGVWK